MEKSEVDYSVALGLPLVDEVQDLRSPGCVWDGFIIHEFDPWGVGGCPWGRENGGPFGGGGESLYHFR